MGKTAHKENKDKESAGELRAMPNTQKTHKQAGTSWEIYLKIKHILQSIVFNCLATLRCPEFPQSKIVCVLVCARVCVLCVCLYVYMCE